VRKIKQIVPAVPGTLVVFYNHCWQTTSVEEVAFWGLQRDESDNCDYVVPMVINEMGGFFTELDLPESEFPKGDPRHDEYSRIIAYEIPGWGRIQLDTGTNDVDGPTVGGRYLNQAKGYVPTLGAPPKEAS
jgi:hypothetical protein